MMKPGGGGVKKKDKKKAMPKKFNPVETAKEYTERTYY